MPSERIQRRIDTFLDQAEAASDTGDWPLVAEKARAVLAIEATNEDALAFLKMAEANAGAGQPRDVATTPATPAPTVSLPESFVSGRYRVLHLLGQGGRKRVYLARDERLGREVAFAVVPGDALTGADRERFLREARAMARLGSNPHLVSIFDIGEDGRDLFTVQEYVAGGDVAGLLARSEGQRLPVERSLSICTDVCRALVAIHKAGIVHRDLKPANVFLAADGSARLGDFGLAADTAMDRLTQHGTMLGTVAYMPPEQALGGDVTVRSDLYSLGALLYEIVTGRPPFLGDATAVITQHLNTPPVAPSYLVERCPASLEKLILQLLEKDPGKRPESASAVLAALGAVNPEEAAIRRSQDRPLERLARGVFVGREKELERLRRACDEAFAGRGGLVMLVGEPGIGKTRTTQELETHARMRGATVLWGRVHESGGAPPYWPWLQVGNQWAASGGNASLSLSSETIGELSRLFPVLRQQPNFVEPQQWDDPEATQFRLFGAYAAFLHGMAEVTPLVLVLDDLHWADKPTLLLLQHVARELSRSRILIVGNYRDTDITRQSALSETLAVLNRESGFERIVLRGLSKAEVASYIRAKANVEPKREVLERIYEETEGNAFFLSEVVNLMAEEGTLAKDSVSDIAIPDGVREALGRRLNRLSPETNELLQVATIIGREFSYDTLVALGDRDEDELLRLIEEAINARVIDELQQPGRYRFTHAQMQETLLAELSTTRRVRLHGQVAEALERRWGDRAERYASRLAEHFVEASMLTPRHADRAFTYSTMAGNQAMAQSAYPEALHHFRAALATREGREIDGTMAEVLFALGKANVAVLDSQEGWRALRQAFRYYSEAGDVARTVDVAEYLVASTGLLSRTQTSMIERALEMVAEDSAEYGRLQAALGYSVGMQGDDRRAQRAFARAKEVASSLALPRLEARTLDFEMTTDAFFGRLEASMAKVDRLVELSGALGDPDREYNAHFIGSINAMLGDLPGGRRHAGACRAIAERSRVPRHIVAATHSEAYVSEWAGDWPTVSKALARGLELDPLDARLLCHAAWMHDLLGERAEAEAYLLRLIESVRARPPGPTLPYAWLARHIPFASFISGQREHLAVAREAAQAVLASPERALPMITSSAQIGVALQAIMSGDRTSAADLLPHLHAYLGTVSMLSIDHLRGLLLEVLGRDDEAIEEVERSLELLHPDYRPLYALAAFDCARIRLDRNAPGDRERALTLMEEVLAIARDLGMRPLVERLVGLKVRAQGITSDDMRSSLVAVNNAVQHERPDLSRHSAPDGTVTIMFTDIEGSTALNVELGDDRWMEVLADHNRKIRACIAAHRGFEVKTEGDAFMVAFVSARDALRCAIAVQRAFVEPAKHLVQVRIGLHTGEPVKQGDDFYGTHVVMASRIAAQAKGGETLVSALLRELVAPSGEFTLEAREPAELKGLEGRHVTYLVSWT